MAIIEEIIAEAGDMPDVAAHRLYLKSLSLPELQERLKNLRLSRERRPSLAITRRRKPVEVAA